MPVPTGLDDLKAEFDEIQRITVIKTQERTLRALQDKLVSLTFLENCTTSLIRAAAA